MQEVISFFKYLATSNTINFILMLVILGWIIKKANLKASMDNSVSNVALEIKKSDDEKQSSQNVLISAKSDIEKLPSEVASLEKEAENKAEILKQQVEDSCSKVVEKIEDSVETAIDIEEKKISNSVTGKTVKASIELAKDNVSKLLKSNPDLHKKFIDESLAEFEKVSL